MLHFLMVADTCHVLTLRPFRTPPENLSMVPPGRYPMVSVESHRPPRQKVIQTLLRVQGDRGVFLWSSIHASWVPAVFSLSSTTGAGTIREQFTCFLRRRCKFSHLLPRCFCQFEDYANAMKCYISRHSSNQR